MEITGSVRYRNRQIGVMVRIPDIGRPAVLVWDEDRKSWSAMVPPAVEKRALELARKHNSTTRSAP